MYFRVPEYRPAIAAWIMHCHKVRRFKVTPRLHVKSVVWGEGKTTLFDILEKLVPNPERDDSTTPAIIADRADEEPPPTFLLDEADNLGLMDNPLFRAVLNSGYSYKGPRTFMGPRRQRITKRTFAPMALASIRNLPGPLMRRSIVIQMRRVQNGRVSSSSMRTTLHNKKCSPTCTQHCGIRHGMQKSIHSPTCRRNYRPCRSRLGGHWSL
jgi:hypothetical protein